MQNKSPKVASFADDDLVIRAQENDDAAFAELMRRTSNSSLRLAWSILRNREEAEDEVQNSYLNAWRNLGQFQREAKFSTWMSRIVVNHCLMRLRKVRSAKFTYLDEVGLEEGTGPREAADYSANPEGSLGSKELSTVLRSEIAGLPPLLQHVLILRDIEELSTAEAARRLGITRAAVKTRLSRARVELRNRLQKHRGRAGWATLTA